MGEQLKVVPAERDYNQLLKVSWFYGQEAMLLDEMRFEEWFLLLADDICYEMPVRTVLKTAEGEFNSGACRFRDRLPHIRMRIDRLSTGHAWAEEPPSRVVRTVGSVALAGVSERGGLFVSSSVVLHRHRGQNDHAEVIAYRRNDELLPVGDEFKLLHRKILAPDNILRLSGVTIFL